MHPPRGGVAMVKKLTQTVLLQVQLTNPIQQDPFTKLIVLQLMKKIPHYMDRGDSLACSQDPATCPCSNPSTLKKCCKLGCFRSHNNLPDPYNVCVK